MKYIIFLLLFIQVNSPIMGITWDGGAGTISWMDAANWEGDIIPQSNEDVIIGPGANVSLSASTQIQSLKLDNATLKITDSGALVVAISSLHAIELDNSDLYNYGKLEVLISWEIGIKMVSASELHNYDSIVIDQAGAYGLELGNTSQLNNYGVIVVNETEGGIDNSGHFENSGEFRVENTITTSGKGVRNNFSSTTINTSSGSMYFENFVYLNSVGFYNRGFTENFGLIHARDVNKYGLENHGLMTNEGNIIVDSLTVGIYQWHSDTLINGVEGVIRLETIGAIGVGLINNGYVENKGQILWDDVRGTGFSNESSFANFGRVEMSKMHKNGILNADEFINSLSGEIIIDKVFNNHDFGISNFGGIVENHGSIRIDSSSGGIRSYASGTFDNSGEILISRIFQPGSSAFATELNGTTINQNTGTITITDGHILTTSLLVEEDAHFQNIGSISIDPDADDPIFIESGSTFDCIGTIAVE